MTPFMRWPTCLAGLLIVLAPMIADAQHAPKTGRVGVLANSASTNLQPFRDGLRDLGWTEGRNLILEYRYAEERFERIPELTRELIRLDVDVILAPSSVFVRGARQATTSVPIVFAIHNDPIGTGDVASLARPGGNITGITQIATDLTPKQIELLRNAVPRLNRLAIVWDPTTPSHAPSLPVATETARRLGMEPLALAATTLADLEKAYATAKGNHADAALVLTSVISVANVRSVAQLALRHRLPTMVGTGAYPNAGGLMSYAPDAADQFRRAASYVDKILRGAKPADLPVEQATRFELVINLKTAKAHGLTIPESLLMRADQVIE